MNRFTRWLQGISPQLYDIVLKENVGLQNVNSNLEKVIVEQKQTIAILETKLKQDKDLMESHVSIELCREILNQKDYEYIRLKKKKELTPEAYKEYIAQSATLLRSNFFRDLLMELQYDCMEDIATKADSTSLLLFNRGTINGVDLVEQRILNAYTEYKRLTGDDSAKGFEKYDPIGRITY